MNADETYRVIYEDITLVDQFGSYDDQSFDYDTIDDFEYDNQTDLDLYPNTDTSPNHLFVPINIPLELRQFTEKMHMERVLSDSLKTKHCYYPSREERIFSTKDVVCSHMLPILIKMGSWKTIVSFFNTNKTMYGYLDERTKKSGIVLKDEIKSQMFAYRQLDSKIIANYYREDADYFIGRKCFVRGGKKLNEQIRCSHYIICANCDEALSITTDTWIFIKEVYIVLSPQGFYHSSQNSYYFQRNKTSVLEAGYWYILEAKNCLDKVFITR